MEDGDSAGGNMNSDYEFEVETDKKTLAAQLLLYPEARLPYGTLAAAQKIIGHCLDWKVASLCKRYAANRCIHNGISHSQTIGFPAPTRKYIPRGILCLSDLGDVPPAAVFRCGFDHLHDVGAKYGAKLKQAAIDSLGSLRKTRTCFLQTSCIWFHKTTGQQKLVGRDSKLLSYRNGFQHLSFVTFHLVVESCTYFTSSTMERSS
jgi:hypothetical protein